MPPKKRHYVRHSVHDLSRRSLVAFVLLSSRKAPQQVKSVKVRKHPRMGSGLCIAKFYTKQALHWVAYVVSVILPG